LLPQVIAGRRAPYSHAGRMRMRMRGLPEIGRTWRMSITGQKSLPNCSNRGARSVISTPPPCRSKSRVLRIGVCAM